jgi:hypothetical protein
MALLAATETNQFPDWNFNKDSFAAVDWSLEPETDIRNLYRLRAQQLRQQYDYIRLEASGGGDSTTAIFSFLKNGIHLDEVVFRYPKTGEKNMSNDPFNTKCENTLSEWHFAAKPILQKLAISHPTIKITMHDFSQNILDQNSETKTFQFSD